MNLTVPELFTYLIHEKHFYASIANKLQRIEQPGLGTMAVGVRGGRLSLFYDPDFVKNVSMRFGVFALDHEMYHLVFDHIPRYLELLAQFVDPAQRERAMQVFNIAADCADNTNQRANSHFATAQAETRAMIKALAPPEYELKDTDGMVLPSIYQLEENKSFEYYQHQLMTSANVQMGRNRQGCRSMTEEEFLDKLVSDVMSKIGNSHVHWIDDQPGDEKEDKEGKGGGGKNLKEMTPEELQGLAQNLRTQAKQVLKQALREQQQSRGLMPAGVTEWLDQYLAEPVIPWWEVLSTRIKTSKRPKPVRGIRQPNRTLLAMAEEDPSIIPAIGTTYDRKFRVFFYEDTSGSQSTEALRIARSELWAILRADEDMEVRVMQGDAETHFDKLCRTGDEPPREIVGRGGTDFESYLQYMAKYVGNDDTEPDIVIVFTDGYCPAPRQEAWLPPEIPVIWLVTKDGTGDYLVKGGYGEVIICSADDNERYKHSKEAS